MYEKSNIGVHFLTNISFDFDEIYYVAPTCWFVEAHAKFIVHKEYSRENCAGMIL